MSYNLVNCIVNHIFDNLGLTLETSVSLKAPHFLLKETIDFINENDEDESANLYGTQIKIDDAVFRLAVVDFLDSEYALIIKLDNCPTYACYLSIDSATGDPYDGLICFSLNKNAWLQTNVSIQGTFLAGMENLKEVTGTWDKLIKSDDLIEELKSFIQYHNNVFGANE